jgi:hypothetical protein
MISRPVRGKYKVLSRCRRAAELKELKAVGELTMHILVSVLLFFVFCALLIVGLLQVLGDLLERDLYAPPSIAESDTAAKGPRGARSD